MSALNVYAIALVSDSSLLCYGRHFPAVKNHMVVNALVTFMKSTFSHSNANLVDIYGTSIVDQV